MSGKNDGGHHPLPDSAEARHDLIPEELENEKGHGDDGAAAVQPEGMAVNPDGEPYPAGAADDGGGD